MIARLNQGLLITLVSSDLEELNSNGIISTWLETWKKPTVDIRLKDRVHSVVLEESGFHLARFPLNALPEDVSRYRIFITKEVLAKIAEVKSVCDPGYFASRCAIDRVEIMYYGF